MTKPRHLLRNYLFKRKEELDKELLAIVKVDDDDGANTSVLLARIDELDRVIRLCEERGRF